MFKTIATAAIAAVALLTATPGAEASQCTRGSGYTICFEPVSANGSYNNWNVALQNSHTTEYMNVTCYGKRMDSWKSNGGFSQSEAAYLARYFCSL